MSPLVRRSWAPRGVTPILCQRTRRREKVSAIAALCVAPTRGRIHLYFRDGTLSGREMDRRQ
jgi:hypothetical protein